MRSARTKFYSYHKVGSGRLSWWPRHVLFLFNMTRNEILSSTWPTVRIVRQTDFLVFQFNWLGFILLLSFGD